MSPDSPIVEADVHMLPPNCAVYMPVTGSSGNNVMLFVPVLVKPVPLDSDHFDVFVPPVFVTRHTTYINWCLVLLSQEPYEHFEFRENGVILHPPVGPAAENSPIYHPARQVSKTQAAIQVDTGESVWPLLVKYDLDIDLRLLGGPSVKSIKATVDPAVSVLPDPVEIPTWP